MLVFGRLPVGFWSGEALYRAVCVLGAESGCCAPVRIIRLMRRFRSFFRTDYCPAPPLILGFV